MPTIYLSSTYEDLKDHRQLIEMSQKTVALADSSGPSVNPGNPNA